MNGIYVLDSVLAAAILLTTVLVVVASRPLQTPIQAPPEHVLSMLLEEPGFVNAIYARDHRTVEAYLNSFLAAPYNLTVWDSSGNKVLSVGGPVEGVAATAVLPGWRGRLERIVVSLRVGG